MNYDEAVRRGGNSMTIPGWGVNVFAGDPPDGLGSVCVCVVQTLEEAERVAELIRQTGDFDRASVRIDGPNTDPGGRSALRAATPDNPRDCPCPTCGAENVLTRIDVARGYQCNRCADRQERGGF